MVQIWGPGLQVIYFRKSHLLPLSTSRVHYEMFEIPHKQLAQGADAISIDMKAGGL